MPWQDSNLRITYLADLRIGNPVLPTELHGIPCIIYLLNNLSTQAAGSHASTKPSRTIGLALINRLLVLFNTPLSSGSFGFHSLPLFPRTCTTTFPPYSLHFGANSWPLRGSELTLSPLAVLTGWVPSISTPSACRSLSLPFRFL